MKPTEAEIARAAAAWQGQSSAPLCEDHSAYFKAHWWCFPGLGKFVADEIAKRN